jgi:hypothetical protein
MKIQLNGDGVNHSFDCFECAIHKLAPVCSECGVKVLGHGVEVAKDLFCSAHCARLSGFTHIVDHVDVEIARPNLY